MPRCLSLFILLFAAIIAPAQTHAPAHPTHAAKPSPDDPNVAPDSLIPDVSTPLPAAAIGPVKTLHSTDLHPGTGAIVHAAAPDGTLDHITFAAVFYLAKDGTRVLNANGQPGILDAVSIGSHQSIPGFEKAVVGMKVGGTRRIFIPAAQAFGATAHDPIPANADIILDIHLLNLTKDLSAIPLATLQRRATIAAPLFEYELGNRLATGAGNTPLDPARAFTLAQKSAKTNLADAQVLLAICNENGIGTAKDPAQAVALYQKAATQNNLTAQLTLAVFYTRALEGLAADHTRAFQLLHAAALKGSITAINSIAEMYQGGNGVTQSNTLAAFWYRQLALTGDTDAQLQLANLTPDPAEAFPWYKSAADHGRLTDADLAVANAYLTGTGTQKNLALGIEYYQAAADTNASAAFALSRIYFNGLKGIPKDDALGRHWLKHAADLGSSAATAQLAQMDAAAAAAAQRAAELAAANAIPKTPPALEDGKAQQNSLNKGQRNDLKRCASSPRLKPADIAAACVNIAGLWSTRPNDHALAKTAYLRACVLGNDIGCAGYGDMLAASGDITAARVTWSSTAPCANSTACHYRLFSSYAHATPPDLPNAVKYGLPLCDDGRDDKVCSQLRDINAEVDFAAIEEHHRTMKIADLKKTINDNESQINKDQGVLAIDQVGLNAATNGFQSLYYQGLIKLTQKSIGDLQKQNADLRGQLLALQGSLDGADQPQQTVMGALLQGTAVVANAAVETHAENVALQQQLAAQRAAANAAPHASPFHFNQPTPPKPAPAPVPKPVTTVAINTGVAAPPIVTPAPAQPVVLNVLCPTSGFVPGVMFHPGGAADVAEGVQCTPGSVIYSNGVPQFKMPDGSAPPGAGGTTQKTTASNAGTTTNGGSQTTTVDHPSQCINPLYGVQMDSRWTDATKSEVVGYFSNNTISDVTCLWAFHKNGKFDMNGAGRGIIRAGKQHQGGEGGGIWDFGDDSSTIKYQCYEGRDPVDVHGHDCLANIVFTGITIAGTDK